MPVYEFHCSACDATFDHMTTIAARDQAVSCPQCGSKRTGRKLSTVMVGAGKPTPGGSGGGHVHSGGCGCGKPHGSCRMN